MAVLAPLIATNLGAKKVPIKYQVDGNKRSAEIPGVLKMAVEAGTDAMETIAGFAVCSEGSETWSVRPRLSTPAVGWPGRESAAGYQQRAGISRNKRRCEATGAGPTDSVGVRVVQLGALRMLPRPVNAITAIALPRTIEKQFLKDLDCSRNLRVLE